MAEKTLLDRIDDAYKNLSGKDSTIIVKGSNNDVTALLIPSDYDDKDLKGKVIVRTKSARSIVTYSIAVSATKAPVRTGPKKGDIDTLSLRIKTIGENTTMENIGDIRSSGIDITRRPDFDKKRFYNNANEIKDTVNKDNELAKKLKKYEKGQSTKGSAIEYNYGQGFNYSDYSDASEIIPTMDPVINKAGTKRPDGLPKFIKVNGNDVVAGYYEFKGVPNSLISDLPAKQRKYGNFARRAQRKMVSDEKIDITNSKFNSKSSQAWEEYNDAREQYNMAEDEATKKKWQKKMDKAEARAKDAGSPIGKSTVRLYVSKYAGNNGKHDLYLQIGNNLALPTKDNDGKILGVNKVSEFTHAKGKKNLVVAVVYPKASSRNSALTSNNMIVFGENKPLQTLVSEWREAEKDESKTAFAERLGGENGLPYETYTALDSESNGDKYIENGSPIVKIGEALKYAKAGVIGAALGATAVLVIVGTQGTGYGFDIDNINRVRDGAREGAETQIAQKLEQSKTAEGGTLFDYQTLNNENNYIIDSGSTESKIQSLVKNLSDIGAIGYTQKDIDNTINDAAIVAVTNLVSGYTYDEVARESSFATLGEKAGKEVGEKNISVDKNKAIYPTASGITTSKEDFVSSLETNGMTEEQATKVADAYTNSFVASYEANYDNEISDGGMEVPEEDFDLNDSQGNLQETVNAITGDNILIVNVHYNDSKKNGVIYGINEEGNLKEISFENTTDIVVTSAEGLETALLSDPESEIKEYASLDGLMFDDYTRNNIYNNLTDENGRIFYQITSGPTHDEEIEVETENENGSTGSDATNDNNNPHYDTVVVTLDKNFNVDKASVNVYSNSGKTESKEGIVKTAVSEITDGKVPGSPALYTLTSEEPETSSYPNQLSQESIEQAQEALREELSNENTNGTQIVPVSKERTR